MLRRTSEQHNLIAHGTALLLFCGLTLALHADDPDPESPAAEETSATAESGNDASVESSGEQHDGDDEASPPSLDDLLGIEEEEQDRSADEAAQREHAEELERRLSEERIADAFAEAIAKMSLSAELLDERFDTGLGTQRVQEEIISKLSQLIDEAQQQQSSSSSSSSSSSASAQPQQDPGQQQGGGQGRDSGGDQAGTGDQETDLPPGQQADVDVTMEEMREEWGALPERVRDMLLQGRQERFSGLYEQLTREYYRRLAED